MTMTDQNRVTEVISVLDDKGAIALLAMWVLKVAKDHRNERETYDDPAHLGHAIAELLVKNGFRR
ncbi:hypothetical protein [Nocardia jiangxiensis]|uniref:hypothetical protein n=1 Tax=Nocardia jiangxiensis TaxID=282685 RepID=UPI0012F6404D|nr:hypothetical protein [Nocardia jiangxiensis]